MKVIKNLKLTLMVLICILIFLVGFVGIYLKIGNSYKNTLPKYKFASDIEGSIVLEMEVDTSKETVYYDKEGKEVDSDEITEENKKEYEIKEIPVNSEENLNSENYKTIVNIMKERLKFLAADQYQIDLDSKTGKIVLTVEDDYIEDIESILPMEGKLQLVDSNTGDTIIDYTDFKSAEATYAQIDAVEYAKYTVYINLKLNNSGLEKINNLDKYKTQINDENEEKTESKLKILFDKDEIAEISYDDLLLTGKILRITTAKDLTSNSSINSKLNTNTIISKLATIGKLPVIYNITAKEYVKSNILNYIDYIVIGMLGLCIVVSIYFIVKYKLNGFFAVISFMANISLFLILIRITDVVISLNGLAGIFGLIVLNTILVTNILKCVKQKDKTFSDNIKSAYLKTVDAFVVSLIVFVVFAFSSMTVIKSMGFLMFWGWTTILLGNLILTVPMLSFANKVDNIK